ncbi:GNAT family N-acetyltransferase, partial [Vibrio mediterranei]|uniref:GNAT family N-acetyltransferase n=1 Tax=Vibrio mediterranei TaxID=689 RepID=UPI001EFC52FF
FMNNQIDEFNAKHWKEYKQEPIGVKFCQNDGFIIGGASARSFGDWLLLDLLWVHEQFRSQGIGERILTEIEQLGKKKGCKKCLLDTLDFQAKPFYEKNGYVTQWTQPNYPKSGAKYFMTKVL